MSSSDDDIDMSDAQESSSTLAASASVLTNEFKQLQNVFAPLLSRAILMQRFTPSSHDAFERVRIEMRNTFNVFFNRIKHADKQAMSTIGAGGPDAAAAADAIASSSSSGTKTYRTDLSHEKFENPYFFLDPCNSNDTQSCKSRIQRDHVDTEVELLNKSDVIIEPSGLGTGKTICSVAVGYKLNARMFCIAPPNIRESWLASNEQFHVVSNEFVFISWYMLAGALRVEDKQSLDVSYKIVDGKRHIDYIHATPSHPSANPDVLKSMHGSCITKADQLGAENTFDYADWPECAPEQAFWFVERYVMHGFLIRRDMFRTAYKAETTHADVEKAYKPDETKRSNTKEYSTSFRPSMKLLNLLRTGKYDKSNDKDLKAENIEDDYYEYDDDNEDEDGVVRKKYPRGKHEKEEQARTASKHTLFIFDEAHYATNKGVRSSAVDTLLRTIRAHNRDIASIAPSTSASSSSSASVVAAAGAATAAAAAPSQWRAYGIIVSGTLTVVIPHILNICKWLGYISDDAIVAGWVDRDILIPRESTKELLIEPCKQLIKRNHPDDAEKQNHFLNFMRVFAKRFLIQKENLESLKEKKLNGDFRQFVASLYTWIILPHVSHAMVTAIRPEFDCAVGYYLFDDLDEYNYHHQLLKRVNFGKPEDLGITYEEDKEGYIEPEQPPPKKKGKRGRPRKGEKKEDEDEEEERDVEPLDVQVMPTSANMKLFHCSLISILFRLARMVIEQSDDTKVVILIYHDDPIQMIRQQFKKLALKDKRYDARVVNTNTSSIKKKAALEAFQSDDPDSVRLLIGSLRTLSTGVNLDDTSGRRPRTQLILFGGPMSITHQATGRIERKKTQGPTTVRLVFARDLGDFSYETDSMKELRKKMEKMHSKKPSKKGDKMSKPKNNMELEEIEYAYNSREEALDAYKKAIRRLSKSHDKLGVGTCSTIPSMAMSNEEKMYKVTESRLPHVLNDADLKIAKRFPSTLQFKTADTISYKKIKERFENVRNFSEERTPLYHTKWIPRCIESSRIMEENAPKERAVGMLWPNRYRQEQEYAMPLFEHENEPQNMSDVSGQLIRDSLKEWKVEPSLNFEDMHSILSTDVFGPKDDHLQFKLPTKKELLQIEDDTVAEKLTEIFESEAAVPDVERQPSAYAEDAVGEFASTSITIPLIRPPQTRKRKKNVAGEGGGS